METFLIKNIKSGLISGLNPDNIVRVSDSFDLPPVGSIYNSLNDLIYNQGKQIKGYMYEVTDGAGFTDVDSGVAFVKYKGTTNGNETDYEVINKAVDGYTEPLIIEGSQPPPTAPLTRRETYNQIGVGSDAHTFTIEETVTKIYTDPSIDDLLHYINEAGEIVSFYENKTQKEEDIYSSILEPTIVSGAYTFDVALARSFVITITEDTTFTMPTLSNSESIVFTAEITGDFLITLTNADILASSDAYNGLITNEFVFRCRKLANGTQKNYVTINNLP